MQLTRLLLYAIAGVLLGLLTHLVIILTLPMLATGGATGWYFC